MLMHVLDPPLVNLLETVRVYACMKSGFHIA
jgi:hypothetical protein